MKIDFDCCTGTYPLEPGDLVVLLQDVLYTTKEDCDEEVYNNYSKWMKVVDNEWHNPLLYIPEGTIMKFVGNKYSCWPTFIVGNTVKEELELATDEIIKMIKIRKV